MEKTLKRRKIDGTTYTLVQESTNKPGYQYEYKVKAGAKTFNPNNSIHTRMEGESMFDEIVRDVQSTQAKARQRERENEKDSQSLFGGSGFGLGGGSGRSEQTDDLIPEVDDDWGDGMDDDLDDFGLGDDFWD